MLRREETDCNVTEHITILELMSHIKRISLLPRPQPDLALTNSFARHVSEWWASCLAAIEAATPALRRTKAEGREKPHRAKVLPETGGRSTIPGRLYHISEGETLSHYPSQLDKGLGLSASHALWLYGIPFPQIRAS